MKNFKIIGIIVLLFIAADFMAGFIDGWNNIDTRAVLNIGKDSPANGKVIPVALDIIPDSVTQVTNSAIGMNVPTGATQCQAYIANSPMSTFLIILLGIIGALAIYGFYCLIRILISVCRKDVFTDRNIRRFRWAIYTQFAFQVGKCLQQWSHTHDAIAQLHIPGYTIQPYHIFDGSWMNWGLLILLTEIFIVAVRIKQENDLTI